MALNINGTTGISGVDGSSAPALKLHLQTGLHLSIETRDSTNAVERFNH